MARNLTQPELNARRDLLDIFERVLARGVLIEPAEASETDASESLRFRISIAVVFRAEVSVAWRDLFRDDD